MICKNILNKILNGLVYVKGKFLKLNTKDFYCVLKLWWGMEIPRYWELCTDDFIIDEFGVKYSTNGKILLNAPDDLVSYKIKEGTIFISSEAFSLAGTLKLSKLIIFYDSCGHGYQLFFFSQLQKQLYFFLR